MESSKTASSGVPDILPRRERFYRSRSIGNEAKKQARHFSMWRFEITAH